MRCFICGSSKVICGVRGFHFCADHQVEANRIFDKYEGGEDSKKPIQQKDQRKGK